MGRDANERHPATTPSRVLLIEPNVRLRRAVQALLELEGYLIWPARDVESGLAVLRAARWPVVVLLSVSPSAVRRDDINALLLRTVTTSGANQWHQHAFLVATTSPEYLCAMVDWLPEGLNLPVLRQPYNVDQLLRSVALAAYSLRLMRASALRYLPPRHTPGDGGPLQPVSRPAVASAAALAVSDALPGAAIAPAGCDEQTRAAADAPAGRSVRLVADLQECVERLRACSQQTQACLSRAHSVIADGYVQHVKLVAAVDRWRV